MMLFCRGGGGGAGGGGGVGGGGGGGGGGAIGGGGGFAAQVRVQVGGDDQADIIGQQRQRKIGVHGEIERV
jgi:hypothetical protein